MNKDILQRTDLTASAKLIHWFLGSLGQEWPGIRRLAIELGMSKGAVQRAVAALKSADLLDTDRSVPKTGTVAKSVPIMDPPAKKTVPKTGTPKADAFDLFYKAYPGKKGGKEKLRKKWRADKLDAKAEHVMAVLASLKKSKQWLKNNGQFIPMMSTWLNQQRWDVDATDIPDKRDKSLPSIARGIGNSVKYGPHEKRAAEMQNADNGPTRLRRLREVQKQTGKSKLTTWQAYLWLAEQEANK